MLHRVDYSRLKGQGRPSERGQERIFVQTVYEVGSINAYDAVLEKLKVERLGDTFSSCPDIKSSDCREVSLTALLSCK